MKVTLLTPHAAIKDMENFAALAALTCRANTDKEYVPSEVLGRIIELGHESILEHINLTYSVKGLSRACLQELARHRHLSLSVESTRHTLHKYLAMSDDEIADFFDKYIDHLLPITIDKELKQMVCGTFLGILRGMKDIKYVRNDEMKYFLPELWPTHLIMTANVRALRHIIKLRTSPNALNEFRILAYSLYEAVPEEYRYLLQDCVYKEAEHD